MELVVLHVTVADDKGEFVADLQQGNFKVSEQKIEQKLSFFSRDDIPVTMGLVIDNSGSMREKRDQVNAAAMTFVRTSNPQDEAFVVNFNDEYYLDTDGDFTSDQKNLHDALARIDTRGSTALYDAVIGSLAASEKGTQGQARAAAGDRRRRHRQRKDVRRHASKRPRNPTLRFMRSASTAKTIWSTTRRWCANRRKCFSQKLAEATGGQAYFPDNLNQVTPMCEQVAKEIRNQYTLGYYPTNTARDGSFRQVQ